MNSNTCFQRSCKFSLSFGKPLSPVDEIGRHMIRVRTYTHPRRCFLCFHRPNSLKSISQPKTLIGCNLSTFHDEKQSLKHWGCKQSLLTTKEPTYFLTLIYSLNFSSTSFHVCRQLKESFPFKSLKAFIV